MKLMKHFKIIMKIDFKRVCRNVKGMRIKQKLTFIIPCMCLGYKKSM